MKILDRPITITELAELAGHFYVDMIKAVADVNRKIIAVDAELHSDLESLLIEDGSLQDNLWGFNMYPGVEGEDFIEFDSVINIRPRLGNRSRDVEDSLVREQIVGLVNTLITKE